jgi:tetratricopeptide (TPR) repeat protein
MRGLIREKFGDADGAIAHYIAAVDAEPERELPLKRLSELYAIQKDYVNGAMWMERYVATTPLALGHQYGILGDYYLAAQDSDNAIKALRKGIEVDAYSFWARYRWAQLQEEQKDHKQAALQYETALRYGFDREPELYARLAKLYQTEGRTADALKLLKTGMRIFPTDPDLYRLYGEIGRGD